MTRIYVLVATVAGLGAMACLIIDLPQVGLVLALWAIALAVSSVAVAITGPSARPVVQVEPEPELMDRSSL